MPTQFKLFQFNGIPVYLKIWFLLLFAWLSPVIVVTIFISVLIHEMAHAFVADRLGYQVDHIHIDFFGGGAVMDLNRIPERDSIKIVVAGPLSNFALASLSYSILGLTQIPFFWTLTVVNFLLFLFNILPIFPMDGGRLLRDILYLKIGDRAKALKISATTSLVVSILLLTWSIWTLNIFSIFFSALFIYLSLRELKLIKS